MKRRSNPPKASALSGFDLFDMEEEATEITSKMVYEDAVGAYASQIYASLVLRLAKLPPRLADVLRKSSVVYYAMTPTGQGVAFHLSWFVDLPAGLRGIGATNTTARALRAALIPRRDLPASEVALHQAPLYLWNWDKNVLVRFDAPPRA